MTSNPMESTLPERDDPRTLVLRGAARVVDIINVSSSANTLLRERVLAMRARGIDNRILCIDGPYVPRLRALGIPVDTVHLPRGYHAGKLILSLFEMVSYLRREKIDLVHTHCSVPGFMGRVAARLAGVPAVIHTVHGYHFHDGSSPLMRTFYVSLERFAGVATDLLLSQNRVGMDDTLRHRIVPADRLRYIGNGIDLEKFHPSVRKSTHGRPVTITCVARFEGVKNHRMLLEAARLLRERGVEFRMRLAGDGPLRAECEEFCRTAGIASHVEFAGYCDDVAAVLADTDIAALTSVKEGIPRAVLEPMGVGLPVVATRVSGTREVVRDQETGFLVELGDVPALAAALERLIGDPALRERLGERGRQVALAEFDEAVLVERLAQMYGEVMRGKGLATTVPGSTPVDT